MSEKWKQKILLIFPFAVLAAGMILTAAFFLHTYRQIAFEHTSALCETILANSPEAEPQLLAALKDYHSLTEQELRGNDYLEKYGYRVDDFCYDFPLDTVLFLILFFLVTACAFGAGTFLSHRKNRKRIDDLTEYLEQVIRLVLTRLARVRGMRCLVDDILHIHDLAFAVPDPIADYVPGPFQLFQGGADAVRALLADFG